MNNKRNKRRTCPRAIHDAEVKAVNKMNAQFEAIINKKKEHHAKGGNGDFHCWCENRDGETVGDCMFPEYELIKRINRCGGDPIYKRWSPEEEKKKWAECQGRIRAMCKRVKAAGELLDAEVVSPWKQFENAPEMYQCPWNAATYYKQEKKKGNNNVRICVGSMGWEKNDGSGIHWEFGLGQ
jgi:hypothetical protein